MVNNHAVPDVISAQGLVGCVDDNYWKPIAGRGRCRKHYARWWRATRNTRRAPALNLKRLSPGDGFAKKVRRGSIDECWPWTESVGKSGHASFFVSPERGKVPAHVYALELATGKPCPPGHEGCHRCDNPSCCNPAHIYYGTRQQNVDDMWQRGRAVYGGRHNAALINDSQALAIRVRFASGESQAKLSQEFGLGVAAISALVNGKNWKHVGGPIRTTEGRRGPRPFRKENAK